MTRAMGWIGAAASLILGALALAFGCMLWLAGFLAIDPEDEVPVSWYVVPLVVGAIPWVGLYLFWARKMVQRLREEPGAGW